MDTESSRKDSPEAGQEKWVLTPKVEKTIGLKSYDSFAIKASVGGQIDRSQAF